MTFSVVLSFHQINLIFFAFFDYEIFPKESKFHNMMGY